MGLLPAHTSNSNTLRMEPMDVAAAESRRKFMRPIWPRSMRRLVLFSTRCT